MKIIISFFSIFIILCVQNISVVHSIEINKGINSLVNEKITISNDMLQKFPSYTSDKNPNSIVSAYLILYLVAFIYLFFFIYPKLDLVGISLIASLFLAFPLSFLTFSIITLFFIINLVYFLSDPKGFISDWMDFLLEVLDNIIYFIKLVFWTFIYIIIDFLINLFTPSYQIGRLTSHLPMNTLILYSKENYISKVLY
jgi:hypothetical protein